MAQNFKIETDNKSLIHYGIKGMKWGVRRYQNKDGTYTKRGLERYRKAEEEYESSKKEKKKLREGYEQRENSYSDYKTAANRYKKSKTELKKAYKSLKQDKAADKGRALYASGKTISDNNASATRNQIAISVGSVLVNRAIRSATGNSMMSTLSGKIIGAGATAASMYIYGKSQYENKKLRAYYARSR